MAQKRSGLQVVSGFLTHLMRHEALCLPEQAGTPRAELRLQGSGQMSVGAVSPKYSDTALSWLPFTSFHLFSVCFQIPSCPKMELSLPVPHP